MRSGCRVFHICADDGSKDSFPCPNGTVFSQMNRVCQWADDVDCQRSPMFYPRASPVGAATPARQPTVASFRSQIPSPLSSSSSPDLRQIRQVSATTPPSFRPRFPQQQTDGGNAAASDVDKPSRLFAPPNLRQSTN